MARWLVTQPAGMRTPDEWFAHFSR
jgi:hypothetical protein